MGVWGSHLGLSINGELRPLEGTPSEYMLSIGSFGGCVQDTGHSAVWTLAPATLGTSGIFHDNKVRYP